MGRPGDYYYAPPPQRAELPPPLPPAEQPRVYHAPAEQPRVYPAPAEQPRVYHAPAEQPRAYPTPAAYYYEEPTTKKPCPRKHAPPRGTPIRISFEDHGPPHEEPIPSHGAYYEAPALPPASPPETYVHPPPPQSPPLTPSYGSYGEERSMSGSASSLAAIQGLSDAHASAIHSLVAGHGSTGGVAVTSEHSEATKNLALAHAAAVKQLTDGHRRALDVPQGRGPAQSVFFSMERPRAETAPGAPIRISGPAAAEGLPKKPIIRILRYNEEILEGHHHSFSFDAANGIHSEDTTTIEHVPGGPGECDKAIVRKKGTYSYTSPEGKSDA